MASAPFTRGSEGIESPSLSGSVTSFPDSSGAKSFQDRKSLAGLVFQWRRSDRAVNDDLGPTSWERSPSRLRNAAGPARRPADRERLIAIGRRRGPPRQRTSTSTAEWRRTTCMCYTLPGRDDAAASSDRRTSWRRLLLVVVVVVVENLTRLIDQSLLLLISLPVSLGWLVSRWSLFV